MAAQHGTLTAPEFGPARPVAGLGAINRSSSSTFTAGAQAFVGLAAGIADVSRSRVNESVYMTDVNGDGLPDLVSGGAVLFNRLDASGEPSFSPDSPTPLGSGAPSNAAGLITVTPEEQAEAEAAFHLVDSVRRWVAPFSGTIDITGQVALAQAGDAAADGVRAAIQLEDAEIFSLVIADPTDLTPKPITGLTNIAVTAGQRLYFRVNSRNDGAFDTVSFDPTITYRTVNGVAVDPATLDENGLTAFATTASADYAYGGRPLPVVVPATGSATLTGNIVKPFATSDEVRVVVTRNGAAVFERVLAPGETGTVPVSVPLTLNQGDELLGRIDVDTRKTQTNLFKTSVKPQTTYDYTYVYPASGAPRPHGATAIGTFDITHDANGNHIRTQEQGTSNTEHYTFDEENRLACANKGQQAPSPSCDAQGETEFTYDHAGVRKRKDASSPTLYPNQYFTDFGGGSGNQFKHVFLGETRLLSKKARPAPDRQHWYYHPDHLGSTSIVTFTCGALHALGANGSGVCKHPGCFAKHRR